MMSSSFSQLRRSRFLSRSVNPGLLCAAALLLSPAGLFATAQADITSARRAWILGDTQSALASLESALNKEPGNEEAHFLSGVFKLAAVLEEPSTEALLRDAGIRNYSNDLFDLRADAEFYPDTEVLKNSASWFHQTETFTTGGDAARSGFVWGLEAYSTMAAVVSGPGSLSFDYKTSIPVWNGFLRVYIDGALVLERSGETPWSPFATQLTGEGDHTITWVFRPGYEYMSTAQNVAWVDNLQFSGANAQEALPGTLDDAVDFATGLTSFYRVPVQTGGPGDVPVLSPDFSGEDLMAWARTELNPRLDESITHFEAIESPDFLTALAADENRLQPVQVDLHDVTLLRATLTLARTSIQAMDGHDLNILIRQVADRSFLPTPLPDYFEESSFVTLQWFFSTFPETLRQDSNADFSAIDPAIREARSLYTLASDGIFARPPDLRRLFNSGRKKPVPGTEWFSQTVVTHDGVDAVQSGSLKPYDEGESILSFEITGPGQLSFWRKLTNYYGSDDLSHGLWVRRLSPSSFFIDSVWGSSDWAFRSVAIPSGTHTIEFSYRLFNGDMVTASDGAFVDEVVFVPTGGSPIPLVPGSAGLDTALDATVGARSEPARVDSLGYSMTRDIEVRDYLQRCVTSLDSTIPTNLGPMTSRPFVAGNADPASLRPTFYLNSMISGSLPDATFSGIVPELAAGDLEARIRKRTAGAFPERIMNATDLNDWFLVDFLGPFGANQMGILYDTSLDDITDVRIEVTSDPRGIWRYNGDGMGDDIFEISELPIEGKLTERFYRDTGIGPDTRNRFYRAVFDFNN